ncbi:hypothetical protein J6590_077649 [Homalodisca vitripennis]|nr:hypothetical protein J6590_077649 [Homalodisca vitripennis]
MLHAAPSKITRSITHPSQASRGQLGDGAAWLIDNRPPRHAPCRLDTTAPAVFSTWLSRAPHLDDDPTALDTALP